jgi:hypothetical protein
VSANQHVIYGGPSVITSRRLLFATIFSFLFVLSASATSYYVTQSGAGSQNGLSLANAWSISSFNSSSKPTGGDTVFFSGTINSQIVPNTNGTGNGPARLTLDFTSATITATTDPKIALNGKNFVNYNGGTFATDAVAVYLFNSNASVCHDITIQNWTFTGPPGSLDAFANITACSNVVIQNNTITNVENFVMANQNTTHDVTILNNFCETSSNTTDQTDVIQIADAINVTIQGNKLVNQAPGSNTNGRHNDVIQSFKSGASQNANPSNWTIRYNWIEVAQQDGSGGNMSWFELENFAGQPALKVYGNVFVGNNVSWAGGNGISIHSGTNSSDTYYFYNNTVYAKQSPLNPIRLGEGDGPGTLYFRNTAAGAENNQGIQATFSAGSTWDNNYFYNFNDCSSTYSGSHGSCSLTQAAFTSTSSNNFYPANGSVLINAGDSTIGSEFDQGIASGAIWPNPALVTRSSTSWDVGAYQSGNADPPPDPPTGLAAIVK